MLIHIGGETVVNSMDVVIILDYQTAHSKRNEKFFKQNQVKNIGSIRSDEIKSYIITKDSIYASSISSSTLNRRSNIWHNIEGR